MPRADAPPARARPPPVRPRPRGQRARGVARCRGHPREGGEARRSPRRRVHPLPVRPASGGGGAVPVHGRRRLHRHDQPCVAGPPRALLEGRSARALARVGRVGPRHDRARGRRGGDRPPRAAPHERDGRARRGRGVPRVRAVRVVRVERDGDDGPRVGPRGGRRGARPTCSTGSARAPSHHAAPRARGPRLRGAAAPPRRRARLRARRRRDRPANARRLVPRASSRRRRSPRGLLVVARGLPRAHARSCSSR